MNLILVIALQIFPLLGKTPFILAFNWHENCKVDSILKFIIVNLHIYYIETFNLKVSDPSYFEY